MPFERPEIGRLFGMTGYLLSMMFIPDGHHDGCTRAFAVALIAVIPSKDRRLGAWLEMNGNEVVPSTEAFMDFNIQKEGNEIPSAS
jgi:hypothetical protein